VLSLLRESASALALHDTNDDRQLDFPEFAAFMARFMNAAGYKLDQVLDELLVLAATKVRAYRLSAVMNLVVKCGATISCNVCCWVVRSCCC
jgi:hypothetical protein